MILGGWPNWLERWLGLVTGRFPAGFESYCGNFASELLLAIPFTPRCQCLSEETLKVVLVRYLIPMIFIDT